MPGDGRQRAGAHLAGALNPDPAGAPDHAVLQDISPDLLDPLEAEVVALVREVMTAGAALGWSGVPTPVEASTWWRELGHDVERGRAAVVVAHRSPGSAGNAGPLVGLGQWRRYPKAPQAVNADIEKVFVGEGGRGAGVGAAILRRLIELAREQGVETLTLDCRGNNHGAIRLYERLGFEEYGRLADFVAAGDERWDKVLLRIDLRTGSEPLHRHGAAPIGEGSSR